MAKKPTKDLGVELHKAVSGTVIKYLSEGRFENFADEMLEDGVLDETLREFVHAAVSTAVKKAIGAKK